MAKSSSPAQKASSKGFSYTPVLVALLALGGAYLFTDKTQTLNKFGEAVTERLCDLLPSKNVAQAATPTKGQNVLTKSSLYNPKVGNGKVYNAKEAMDARYLKLQEVCNQNADVMTPQSYAQKHGSKPENFLLETEHKVAFCHLKGVAAKSFDALFMRLRGHGAGDDKEREAFKENFPHANLRYKKAIMVRHPMERLISVYRSNFAATFNPTTGQTEENTISFQDFIHLIIYGPAELAAFLQENRSQGESVGIDTGMVDAEGQSQAWDSYWHRCGLCHPDFRPHYILHFDHAAEDEAVLVEVMGNADAAKKWMEVKHEGVAGTEEAIRHFYGQLTKSEIRAIYKKYQLDFELFGYDPDYFVQFGQDE